MCVCVCVCVCVRAHEERVGGWDRVGFWGNTLLVLNYHLSHASTLALTTSRRLFGLISNNAASLFNWLRLHHLVITLEKCMISICISFVSRSCVHERYPPKADG